MIDKPFSQHLKEWGGAHKSPTLIGLIDSFAEKSFAILFLFLMAIPALPLPTGGVTHVFAVISMLLSLELVYGLKHVWLPKKWKRVKLPAKMQSVVLPMLVKSIRKLEVVSRKRLSSVLTNNVIVRLTGLLVFIFSFFVFFAPPFSGLDTLPAIGVVLISLAIILEDFSLFLAGAVTGSIGVGVIVGLSKVIVGLFTN